MPSVEPEESYTRNPPSMKVSLQGHSVNPRSNSYHRATSAGGLYSVSPSANSTYHDEDRPDQAIRLSNTMKGVQTDVKFKNGPSKAFSTAFKEMALIIKRGDDDSALSNTSSSVAVISSINNFNSQHFNRTQILN